MVEKCEMFASGNAYQIYPQEEMRRNLSGEGGYVIREELVLCPIKAGKCPYKKEAINGKGEILRMFDGTLITKSICTSKGLVEMVGKVDLKKMFEEEKSVNDNPKKYRAF